MIIPTPKKIEPGQESVWDYPRPPALEHVSKHIRIIFAGKLLVDAPTCFRVLETSHPPVYYVEREFILPDALRPAQGTSMCEWKGRADYFDVCVDNKIASRAAWRYSAPTGDFAPLAGCIAFYAGPMDSCIVDGEIVTPQPGAFYGGWVTRDIVGPFKGETGSTGW